MIVRSKRKCHCKGEDGNDCRKDGEFFYRAYVKDPIYLGVGLIFARCDEHHISLRELNNTQYEEISAEEFSMYEIMDS
jgi:hypothetical protein